MIKKLVIGLLVVLLLIAAVPAALVAGGVISTSSWSMIVNVILGKGIETPEQQVLRQRLQLPAGFSVSVYQADLPQARLLLFTSAGDLLVSRPHAGDVVLIAAGHNGVAGEWRVLLSGLSRPLGLALHGDYLYVAEDNAVGRVAFDQSSGEITGQLQPVVSGLGNNGNHWSKSIAIGPDEKLYLSLGSTCNVCIEQDPMRATLWRYDLDGSNGRQWASGLRNSVGMDWAPWSGELYATDNGRDLLGDDFPPCELNRITEGSFYGWPFFNGANIPDPDLGKDLPAGLPAAIVPAHGFAAHNAPLGMRFITNAAVLPPDFSRAALVALHGSWNRSTPDGYKVVSLHWQADGSIEQRDFLAGFERDSDIIGRPVDVVQGPDGAIYVSDDYAGAIYRVTYQGD